MKASTGVALAGTAGLAAFGALTSSAYVLPNAVGDQRFADDAAAAAAAAGKVSRDLPLGDLLAQRNPGEPIRLQLNKYRREPLDTYEKVKAFAQSQRQYVEAKYKVASSSEEARKRQIAGLVDYGFDTFYFAQVAVGTPAQNFNVILDTGSADFWVTDSSCESSQCAGVALYNSEASSTSVSSSTPFQIQYGSGAVRGTLFADTTSLAGYTVYNLTVAGVDQLVAGTLTSPISGIMGMGLQQLTTSGATPFWEVLAKSGKLPDQAFTFQLSRNLDAESKTELNSGGTFTLGEIDDSQYEGDISWTELPDTTAGQRGYWAIPLDSVTLNGNSIDTNGALAAIDTGTTLIGAPSDVTAQVYQQIPGAQAVDIGGASGYYAYPCSSDLAISMTFGGKSWTIKSEDFSAGVVGTTTTGGNYCVGAIFATDLGTGAPEWIVGDTFLKNVFSIYEYAPTQRIGFAALNNGVAQNAPVTLSVVPSGTAANAVASSTAVSSASVGATIGPQSIASGSGSSATGIVGGSGLPDPVAAASNSASTPLTSTSSLSSSSPVAASPSTSVAASSTTASVYAASSSQPTLSSGDSSLSGGSSNSNTSGASGTRASMLTSAFAAMAVAGLFGAAALL